MSQNVRYEGPFYVYCRDLYATGDRDWYNAKHAVARSERPDHYPTIAEARKAAREILKEADASTTGIVCKICDNDESLPNYGHIEYVYPSSRQNKRVR